MINVAIVGYGNIGRGVEKAVKRNADMKLVALFTRRPELVKKEVNDISVLHSQEDKLPEGLSIDVAILAVARSRIPQSRVRILPVDLIQWTALIPTPIFPLIFRKWTP